MDPISGLSLGFQQVFDPANLAFLLLGVVLGLVVGVLPGLGATSGVAILLPVTVFIAPNAAVMLLAGIYWGALFGGVVTSILFNIPGEPWTVALVFDGHPLAKMGKAGLALTTAFVASFISAWIANLLFTFFAVPLAEFALRFGPPEIFAIMLLAFGTFVGLGGESAVKTIIMMAAGFLLASVGLDIVTGQPRLTFGSIDLLEGFNFVPVTIGLFGLGEILASADEAGKVQLERIKARLGLSDLVESIREHGRRVKLFVVTTLIGFWVGVMPGTGATPASFMGYGLARQYSKNPERFGKGAIEGVIAPQAGANAAGVGSILPMITLGVPGSPTAAVIMAGLFIWGLTPGPRLFIDKPDFVWGLIASLYVAHTATFLLCLLAVPALAALMRIPYALLTPLIVALSILGAYAINNSMFHVWLVLIFGVLGYLFKKLKYPIAPLVVALVLGDPTESALRQTLIMSGGSLDILFTRPLSGPLTVLALLLFLLPAIRLAVRHVQQRAVTRQAQTT
ncbi:MAG TPA: tripartite tricarboxylate transporter permease [Chloroflexota bacterium]